MGLGYKCAHAVDRLYKTLGCQFTQRMPDSIPTHSVFFAQGVFRRQPGPRLKITGFDLLQDRVSYLLIKGFGHGLIPLLRGQG